MRGQNSLSKTGSSCKGVLLVIVCTCMAAALSIGGRVAERSSRKEVYALSGRKEEQEIRAVSSADGAGVDLLPTGIAGTESEVERTISEKKKKISGQKSVERIGTSCEQVMVGQRVRRIEERVAEFDVSSSMESKVNVLNETAAAMAQSAVMMSDEDYDTLLHIVEAEAGTEDVKGRVLVANVIMNRVKNEEFPDTVTEVVWERTNGVPQFSPTYDGRIHEVTVSEETKEAVKQVLNGVDYSEGALFFIQKSEAEKHNVSWFEKDLKRLFKYGVHEFYTYPDETGESVES